MLSVNEINLLAAQNEKLKEQNRNLQKLVREQEKRINELEAQKEKKNE